MIEIPKNGGLNRRILKYVAIAIPVLYYLYLVVVIFGQTSVPYALDGNETYSSLLHARNLLTFGWDITSGLADESSVPWADGHPVLHTHQGNFPRLPATILVFLGADGPTSQIAIHAIAFGVLSLILFLLFLSKYTQILFVCLFGLFLVSDYLFFLQWQIVTYRVWHFAFVSLLFYFGSNYLSTGSKKYLAVCFLVFVCLFYYEITFAIFVASWVCLHLLIFCLIMPKTRLKTQSGEENAKLSFSEKISLIKQPVLLGVAGVCAALIAFGSLFLQIIHHMGIKGLLNDIHYTFNARNWANSIGEDQKNELRNFVDENNLAFFYNYVDSSTLKSFDGFLNIITEWGIAYYTPLYGYLFIATIVSPCLANLFFSKQKTYTESSAVLKPNSDYLFFINHASMLFLFTIIPTLFTGLVQLLASALGFISIVAYFYYTRAFIVSNRASSFIISPPLFVAIYWSLSSSDLLFSSNFSGFESVILSMILTALPVAINIKYYSRESIGVLLNNIAKFPSIFLISIFVFSLFSKDIFGSSAANLILQMSPFNQLLARLVLASSFIGICILCLKTWGVAEPKGKNPHSNISPKIESYFNYSFVISGLLALILIFYLIPGYVYSGYLYRTANFFGLLFVFIITLSACRFNSYFRHYFDLAKHNKKISSFEKYAFYLISVIPLCALLLHWTETQFRIQSLFPPNSFEIYAKLKQNNAIHGKFHVSNTYTAPFSIAADSYGYLDHNFGKGEIELRKDGYAIVQDRKYLWFADSQTNNAYDRPDYFICYINEAMHNLPNPKTGKYLPGCSLQGILMQAANGDNVWPDHKIIAQDASGRDRWAIVELDWRSTLGIWAMNEKVTHNDDGTVLLSLTPKIVGKSLMPAEVMTTLYRVKSRNGACFLGASIKTTSNPLNSDNAVHQQAFDITNEVFLNENDMLIAVSEIKIGDFRMPKSYSRTIGMPTHEGQIGIFESGCSSFVESK